MFTIVLTKEAQLDIDEIFFWYEEQKAGLGFDFINRFEIIRQWYSLKYCAVIPQLPSSMFIINHFHEGFVRNLIFKLNHY